MTDLSLFLLLVFALALLIAVLFLLLRAERRKRETEEALHDVLSELMEDMGFQMTEQVSARIADIRRDIGERLSLDADENRKNRVEISETLERMSETQNRRIAEQGEAQLRRLYEYQETMQELIKRSLLELQDANKQKLSDIQTEINKKLDTSLNERLDASFKTVGEQLNKLYASLGELTKLEDGVMSLNRTLANVKSRGVFGEAQLENILADILANTLYDKNVITKKSDKSCRDAVEFAVKIPDKELQGAFMYLPIDSKFPATIYDRIRDAQEQADTDALQKAVKELEQFIKGEAKTIQEKYLDPPNTTDFGIMFLPTESLYAEVLRIPGLSEECQRRFHIVITGPTTITALLNSLSIGFRYMAVNKDSQNILKLLSAIKTQYAKFSELLETADNRLGLAKKATDELRHRTDIINKRLSSVEELDAGEAKALLGFGGASVSFDGEDI